MRTSLYDVAPRLAAARDVEKWNIWCAGDEYEMKDGDRWAETVSARHVVQHCRWCHGTVDHFDIRHRFLYGCNRGRVGRVESWRCRNCPRGWHSRLS